MLRWRLKALSHWASLERAKGEPRWANITYEPIDYQSIVYYSAPKGAGGNEPKSLEDVDPELLRTYEKLGIPLKEQAIFAGVAVDAVFDSVSVATTFKHKLSEMGIIFAPFRKRCGSIPNWWRSTWARWFRIRQLFRGLELGGLQRRLVCYVPKGVRCPLELSTYFRINAAETGQFERTLIVADKDFLCKLSGGLHRAHPRPESTACRGCGIGGARQRADQVRHR